MVAARSSLAAQGEVSPIDPGARRPAVAVIQATAGVALAAVDCGFDRAAYW